MEKMNVVSFTASMRKRASIVWASASGTRHALPMTNRKANAASRLTREPFMVTGSAGAGSMTSREPGPQHVANVVEHHEDEQRKDEGQPGPEHVLAGARAELAALSGLENVDDDLSPV